MKKEDGFPIYCKDREIEGIRLFPSSPAVKEITEANPTLHITTTHQAVLGFLKEEEYVPMGYYMTIADALSDARRAKVSSSFFEGCAFTLFPEEGKCPFRPTKNNG